MLLPALGMARYKAKTTLCVSNMRQLGLGFLLYTGDFKTYYPVEPPASNGANILGDGTIFRWDQKVQCINNYTLIQDYWDDSAGNVFLCPHAEQGVRDKYGDSWPYRQTNAYVQCYMLFYNTTAKSSAYIAQTPRMRRVGQRWQDIRSSLVKYKYFNILAGDAMFRPAYGTGAVSGVGTWDIVVDHQPYGAALSDTFYTFTNGYGAGYPAWTALGGANANYLFDDGSVKHFANLKLGSTLDGPRHARVPVEAALATP